MRALVWAVVAFVFGSSTVHAQTEANPTIQLMTAFKPPYEYREWYKQAEECSGRRGNFSKIRWFVVPHPWGADSTGRGYTHAQWQGDRNAKDRYKAITTILVNGDEWRQRDLVMHEALHDILYRSGWSPDTLKLQRELAKVTTRKDSVYVEIAAMHPMPPYEYCAPTTMPRYIPPKEVMQPAGTWYMGKKTE